MTDGDHEDRLIGERLARQAIERGTEATFLLVASARLVLMQAEARGWKRTRDKIETTMDLGAELFAVSQWIEKGGAA